MAVSGTHASHSSHSASSSRSHSTASHGHAATGLDRYRASPAPTQPSLTPVERGEAARAADAKEKAKAAPEVCRVEVRFTPILGGLANHAFVVTSDANSTRYFRGGPSARTDGINSGSSNSGTSNSNSSQSSRGNHNAAAWGTIITEHGNYRPKTIDWTTTPSGHQDVARVPGNCDSLDRAFARHADDIQAANISYGPLGPNSNSTAREILERAGFTGVSPVVNAPSWDIQLPMPR